jgi:outer membrane protein insertion porin family
MQQASVEFSVPGSEFEYFKVNYNLEHYWNFAQGFSLLSRFNASYGNGYGDTEELPYFERYYAGGSSTLRGFERNVVGPRQISRFPTCATVPPGTDPSDSSPTCPYLPPQYDTIVVGTNRAVGGNARVLGGWDLIFPTPFAKESRSVRTSFFVDFANLWDTEFDRLKYAPPALDAAQFDKIPDNSDDTLWRASYGLSLQWLSPMGPIGFHLSRPIRKEDGDRLENFGFTIGQTF